MPIKCGILRFFWESVSFHNAFPHGWQVHTSRKEPCPSASHFHLTDERKEAFPHNVSRYNIAIDPSWPYVCRLYGFWLHIPALHIFCLSTLPSFFHRFLVPYTDFPFYTFMCRGYKDSNRKTKAVALIRIPQTAQRYQTPAKPAQSTCMCGCTLEQAADFPVTASSGRRLAVRSRSADVWNPFIICPDLSAAAFICHCNIKPF